MGHSPRNYDPEQKMRSHKRINKQNNGQTHQAKQRGLGGLVIGKPKREENAEI